MTTTARSPRDVWGRGGAAPVILRGYQRNALTQTPESQLKALGSKARGRRLGRMKSSPQWHDGGFGNGSLTSLDDPREGMPLAEFLCPTEQRKPLAPLPAVDPTQEWRRPPETSLRVTWLGHSTVLLELAGRRVLTDPMWSRRASPTQRIGPKRFQPVPVGLDALPELDVVLLSHDHYDHLDYRTIRALRKSTATFVTALGVGAHLEAWGVDAGRIVELDWWEEVALFNGELVVTGTPAQHFSGRSPGGRNQTLWSSFVVESESGQVYFGGDSGLTTGFSEIGERFEPFDLILLEIGAYHPAWANVHLGPENALAALRALGGGPLLPIHWGTFDLSTHRWDQPIESLVENGAAAGAELVLPRLGEPCEPRRGCSHEAWWREVPAHDAEIGATTDVPLPIPTLSD